MNDFHILSLLHMDWSEVILSGIVPRPRFNSASTMIGTRLLLVGGIGSRYKISKDLEEIELD